MNKKTLLRKLNNYIILQKYEDCNDMITIIQNMLFLSKKSGETRFPPNLFSRFC